MGGGILKAITIQGSSPTIYSTTYNKFSGVDFYSDPMMVAKNRSPYAVNLISDSADMPEKRPGWETLWSIKEQWGEESSINGMWVCNIDGEEHFIVHEGSRMHRWKEDEAPEMLYIGVADGKSTAFFMHSKLYILTGEEYLSYDGTEMRLVEPYVPTVVVNRPPNGDGGDSVEAFNLIGNTWIEEFTGDGTSVEYQLSDSNPYTLSVICEVLKDGVWAKMTQGTDFSVTPETGKVTFTTAPAKSNKSNVRITATRLKSWGRNKIYQAKSAVVYNDSVVFVCGSERGVDYRSGYDRPDYFPDDGYDRIGTSDTDIMGYCRVGEYLGIIKEPSEQESTIYLRWSEQITDANGKEKTIYRNKQGIAGVGAVSRQAIGMLGDEPLFLSDRGVFAITSNAVTYDRTVQNRSEFVDFKLTREPNLQNAVTCEWNGYFIVAVNGHCYLLDSRQRTAKNRNSSDFVYECFYWDNVPEYREENPATVTCFLSTGGKLYFGTSDGRICKFKTDVPNLSRYNDDGRPIVAIWSTCADDDGHPQRLKTMVKKGCAVTLKPFYRSSAKIYVRTEKDAIERKAMEKAIQAGNVDIFNWEDIDFDRFTFNSNDAPQDIMIRKKIKKYKRLQFIVQNDAVDEGFGIFQITKSYMVQGLAKK